MSKLARAWTWIRENGTALLVVSGFVGGFWVAAGSLATKDDFERATRSLATRADLAPLASRADLATTERTVNTLRETVAGLATAVDGLNGAVTTRPGKPDAEDWPSKFTGFVLQADDVMRIVTPSSGGYGDPLERDPEVVLADVLDGFTTLELAERDYGVVIDRGAMRVDGEATAALRSSRRE